MHDLPAARFTTYRGGGRVKCAFAPTDAERAAEFFAECVATGGEAPFVLGGGSKTVIADGEVSRPVLYTGRMRAVRCVGVREDGRVLVRAEGGARVSDILAVCADHGCGGAEFMCGVPATAGGMVRMNAGAFGEETADIVEEAEVSDPLTGESRRIRGEDIGFAYRRGAEGFVTAVTFAFIPMSAEESAARRESFLAYRRAHQPSKPSCGSMFKRSVLPAWALIEDAGLKGVRLGGAEISRLHANFVVNTGGGSAADLTGLAEFVGMRVRELFGIALEKEFEILADDLPF